MFRFRPITQHSKEGSNYSSCLLNHLLSNFGSLWPHVSSSLTSITLNNFTAFQLLNINKFSFHYIQISSFPDLSISAFFTHNFFSFQISPSHLNSSFLISSISNFDLNFFNFIFCLKFKCQCHIQTLHSSNFNFSFYYFFNF